MSRIKTVFKCPQEYKNKFKDSRCLLAISVGQEYHEGEKFVSTIEAVNKTFKSCVILVGDTLQRHTLALRENKTADELFDTALKAGDEWLERNKEIYNRLTIPFEIVRWNRFLFHDKFAEQKKIIESELKGNEAYAQAFTETANKFIERYIRKTENKVNLVSLNKVTSDYLIEECVALCLWVELGCHFDVYPYSRNKLMDMTHQKFVINCIDLLSNVSLEFIKETKGSLYVSDRKQCDELFI